MTCPYEEKLPFLAAGSIPADEAKLIQAHIIQCVDCTLEWKFWQEVAVQVNQDDAILAPPEELDIRVLHTVHPISAIFGASRKAISLLKSQAYLVRGEIWPACAGVMALGVILVILSKEAAFLTFLAPLVAAASLAAIYGPQNDPASELALATPTSPWKVLLARLTLVSGYNFLLAVVSSLMLLTVIPADIPGGLILSWLGPLTFLSALALMLSLWIGTGNAITITYALWIVQYIRPPRVMEGWVSLQVWNNFIDWYRQFWQSPGLLMLLAALVITAALLSTRRLEHHLSTYTG